MTRIDIDMARDLMIKYSFSCISKLTAIHAQAGHRGVTTQEVRVYEVCGGTDLTYSTMKWQRKAIRQKHGES